MTQFTHLHVHSQYSLLDGAAKIESLIKKAKELGMTAIALTDHGSMFGIKKFFNTANKEGIKPIIGCEMYVAPQSRFDKKAIRGEKSSYHLIVLAKNETGYRNLLKLASYAWIEGHYYRPRIDKELLRQYSEGLIVSSACLGGEVAQMIMQKNFERAEAVALEYKEMFGDDYYLELMLHPPSEFNPNPETYEKQKNVNEYIKKMSKKLGIKCIATNDSHFLNKEDAYAHNILINLNTNQKNDDDGGLKYTGQEYFKSPDEMLELFPDCPETLENTMEIANKIEVYDINSKAIMPVFDIPDEYENDFAYLRHLTYEGANERWGNPINEEIKQRLDFELEVIGRMGFSSYFLIVADFIKAARDMGVSVGPGRGSAAGSAVAYCLKITNIDPVKYNLLFERFLNPDRISMPDIDIDFDEDGREKVLQWVADKYGHKRVAHIITFGTMAPKMAIKDVSRVLNVPLSEADKISKSINEKAKSFKEAIELSPEFAKYKKEATGDIAKVFEYAGTLEGCARQFGVHACGTIIGRDDLENYLPLMVNKDAKLYVTQYDGAYVEEIGLLKMDFLGLRTLSIIQDALDNIKRSKGITIDIDNISLEDPKVFELFAKGDTNAIFQFESDGMKKHMKSLNPNRFEDLIAMNALYRPGPMDYIQDFIDRKQGRKKIEYEVPAMEEFLSTTYGITVYQEQVMLLSQKLAGFTKGQADALRKAMGKKKKDIIDKMKPLFIEGCANNQIPQNISEKIWTDWEAFASYAFNKSHSTCYAYLAYQTAYLKAYHPAEFLAAVLSRNSGTVSQVAFYMEDARQHNIDVFGPDVNESYSTFTVNKKGQIRFGMSAIKSVGSGVVEDIIKEREKNGLFKDIYNFVERVNPNSVNKRVLEGLIFSGALDSLITFQRKDFFSVVGEDTTFADALLKYGSNIQNDKMNSQASLFGVVESQIQIAKPQPTHGPDWSIIEVLNKEKEFVGMYLSSHPLESLKAVIQLHTNVQLSDLVNISTFAEKEIRFAGIVTIVEQRISKTGTPFAFLTIEDFSGSFKFPLFSKNYIEYKNYLEKNLKLFITGSVKPRRDNPEEQEFVLKSINLLENMSVKSIAIKIPVEYIGLPLLDNLKQLFENNKGNASVQFLIFDPKTKVWIQMVSQNYKIDVSEDVINTIKTYNLEYKLF